MRTRHGVLMAASEVPLAIVDGELGRIVQGPAVTTWPKLQPASVVSPEGAPANWDSILPNQRFVPQSPPDPVDPVVPDDCLADCGDELYGLRLRLPPAEDCPRGRHRLQTIFNDEKVRERARDVR